MVLKGPTCTSSVINKNLRETEDQGSLGNFTANNQTVTRRIVDEHSELRNNKTSKSYRDPHLKKKIKENNSNHSEDSSF